MEILFHPLKRILLILLVSGVSFGQAIGPCSPISPEAAKRQFDVASVKREPVRPANGSPINTAGGPGTNDPGRFTAAQTALLYLVIRAYGLDPDQLKGPSWLDDAWNSGYAISASMPASTTQEEFCGMQRNLITERFHLAFHYEKQLRPGYELTVTPGGPKFKEFVPDPDTSSEGSGRRGLDANGFPILSPGQTTARLINTSRTGVTKESFRGSIALFTHSLVGVIGQWNGTLGPGLPLARVVDKTGLAGIYEFRLEFEGIPSAPAPAASDPVDTEPNIFSAVQQQLGLKLTKVADVQVDVMIIDHIDQTPTEN